MKVYVAEEAGFCFGVKRALEIIERLHEEGHEIYIYGQLIHNRTVLDDLKARGIDCVDTLDRPEPDKTLVIRTHGIPKTIEKNLETTGVRYVDATCPLVKKLQNIIEKLAGSDVQIVIVGDRNHPEITAAASYAEKSKHPVIIIDSEEDALRLEPLETIGVVAQTTLDSEYFDQIVSILRTKAKKLQLYTTICNATKVRQEAIRKLAPNVDFVVVAGGKNSSNTRKLFNIASKQNKNTYYIENSSELYDPHFIREVERFHSVGITAGASTPPDEIEKIKNFFNTLKIEKEMNHGRNTRHSNTEH